MSDKPDNVPDLMQSLFGSVERAKMHRGKVKVDCLDCTNGMEMQFVPTECSKCLGHGWHWMDKS